MHLHDLRRQIAVRPIPPKSVGIQHLDVDPALVQFLNAIWSKRTASRAAQTFERCALHRLFHLGERCVRVDVHHLDALAVDPHFVSCAWSAGLPRALQQRPACQKRPSRDARRRLEEFSAIPHALLLVC